MPGFMFTIHPLAFLVKLAKSKAFIIVLASFITGSLLGVSGQGALAGVNDSNTNKVSGCVKDGSSNAAVNMAGRPIPPNSILRLIDPDTSCLSGEQRVNWTRYFSTVTVGPIGTQVANGTALLAALQAAPVPALIKLEPGSYDLSGAQLVMRPGISIEGSGSEQTLIKSTRGSAAVDSTGAVITGNGGSSELRELKVEANGAGQPFAIGIFYSPVQTFSLSNVIVSVSGATDTNYGVYRDNLQNQATFQTFTRLTVNVSGGANTVAVQLVGLSEVILKDCNLKANSGSVTNRGIIIESGTLSNLSDQVDGCSIEVISGIGSSNIAIQLNKWTLAIRNSDLLASTTTNVPDSSTIKNTAGILEITNTHIRNIGANIFTEGIPEFNNGSTGSTRIENSTLEGFINTQATGITRVANTRLSSSVNNGGTVTCFNTYNNNFIALNC